MDGFLKIKTKIDNKNVDKGIVELENKIKRLQTNNTDLSGQEDALQKEINKYDELKNKVDEYADKIINLKNQYGKINSNGQLVVPRDVQSQILAYISEIKEANIELDKQAPKMAKINSNLSKIKQKQTENNEKIAEYKQKIESINIKNHESQINNIGNGIKKQISSIAKLSLAVFGIRTAWGMVRQAVSTVAQYNPQIATDLEYMKFALANTILPIVEKLVSLAFTLLGYINSIVSAWFGINLFSNSSAKKFQQMKSGASGTTKAVKELKKELQGFDEMNVLSDSSSSGGSGGTSAGGLSPSIDLSQLQGDVPKWLKWIIDNKNLILAVLAGIASAITLIKLGIGGITALGLGVLIAGIVKLILDVITFLKDPSWSNFANILIDISIILAGIAILTKSWELGLMALVAVVAGLVIKLVAENQAIMSVEDSEKKLKKATEDLQDANENYIDSVDKAEQALKALKEAEDKTGLSGEELNRMVETGILDYKNMTAEQKEVYKAYLDNNKAQKDLKDATDKLTQAKKNEKMASWENKLAVMAEKGQYEEYKNAVIEAFKKGELSAEEARDLIARSMSGMSTSAKETFVDDIPDDIKSGLDTKQYDTPAQRLRNWLEDRLTDFSNIFSNMGIDSSTAFGKAFTTVINAILSAIETKINNFINSINKSIDVIKKIPRYR